MCFIVVFQSSVVFHIEEFIWFALQSMPGFYLECYTGLKWNISKEILLTCPKQKFQAILQAAFWESVLVVHPSSNGESLTDVQHSMSKY